MQKNKLKYKAIIATASFLLITAPISPNKSTQNEQIAVSDEVTDIGLKPFTTYSLGLVYFGTEEEIEEIKDKVNENDILIINDTDGTDPNYRVISSYRITNVKIQNEIINIIQFYNEVNPSDWKRSYKSMKIEWFIHNALHSLGISLDHTTDIDFDNDDENMFNAKSYRKLFD